MVVLKYLLAACLVAAGCFAYTKRDDIVSAYEWSPTVEQAPFPSFDPKAVADQRRIPVPESGLVVARGADTRGAAIPTVPAAPTVTPVALAGGTASLDGVVVGPSGEPLANATVRIERFEGEQSGALDLTTNAQGAFRLPEALGGRYRVRAWRAPTYTQDGSEVTFVTAGEQRSFRLQVGAPGGDEFRALVDRTEVIIGQTTAVTVRVRGPYVNANGQVELGGRAGQEVSILGSGVLTGLNGVKPTDSSGIVTFVIACNQLGPGAFTVSAAAGNRSFSITCIPVPTTTSTTSTTAPAAGTPGTTPGAGGGSSATTTTRGA